MRGEVREARNHDQGACRGRRRTGGGRRRIIRCAGGGCDGRVEIDGKAVDATGAPILLANRIGGCLPSSVTSGSGPGGPGGPGMPGGMVSNADWGLASGGAHPIGGREGG